MQPPASLLSLFCARYSPVGVFFLIVGKLMELPDLVGTLAGLGLYMLTVLVGLVLHGCIVLPLVYLVVARRNPLKLVYGVLQALMTALATSSRLVACIWLTVLSWIHNPSPSVQFGDPTSHTAVPGAQAGCGREGEQVHGPHRGHCQHGRHSFVRGGRCTLHSTTQDSRTAGLWQDSVDSVRRCI